MLCVFPEQVSEETEHRAGQDGDQSIEQNRMGTRAQDWTGWGPEHRAGQNRPQNILLDIK